MASLEASIPTPCGTFKYKLPIPGLPPIPFPPAFSFKLPSFSIPFPDCSLLKHTGSAPEPPEDSEP
jgi:hypothetical protein